MPRRYRPREIIRVLERFGWEVSRQRGSHVILNKEGQPGMVSVPTSQREMPTGTFGEILRQAGLDRREFDRMADEVL